MKQFLFMIFAFGLVISVVASAIAQDTPPVQPKQTAAPEPRECDSVMSTLLQKKKEALDRRERTIKAREADLKSAEERLKTEMEKLTTIRNDLRDAMKGLDQQQQDEVDRLTAMFSKMRGKKAALIMEETEPKVVVEVLKRMDKKKAGEALAAMSPEYASQITEMISTFPLETQ